MSRRVGPDTPPNRALVSLLARHPRAVLLAVVLLVGLATGGVAAEPGGFGPASTGSTSTGP